MNKTFNKSNFIGMTVNGYQWFGFSKDIHSFMKEFEKRKWFVIECKEEQLTNGDLEYMTKNNLTQKTTK